MCSLNVATLFVEAFKKMKTEIFISKECRNASKNLLERISNLICILHKLTCKWETSDPIQKNYAIKLNLKNTNCIRIKILK